MNPFAQLVADELKFIRDSVERVANASDALKRSLALLEDAPEDLVECGLDACREIIAATTDAQGGLNRFIGIHDGAAAAREPSV